MADPLSVLFVQDPGRRVTIGSIVVDATVRERHEYSAAVTDHPIEEGGFITDHIYENPRIVTVEGEITDSPVMFFSVLGGLSNRRVEAYDQLVKLYQQKDIVTLVTGLKIYTDMVIQNLVFPREQNTGKRLQFTAEFKEVRKVSSQVVGVVNASAENEDKVSGSKDLGRQETTPPTTPQETKAREKSVLLDILGG